MELEDVITKFGVNPTTVGLRHRGWWIVDKIARKAKP
jgi:hypothetical protein